MCVLKDKRLNSIRIVQGNLKGSGLSFDGGELLVKELEELLLDLILKNL